MQNQSGDQKPLIKNGASPKSQKNRSKLNSIKMNFSAKTFKIVGFTCFVIGIISMLGFIAYTVGTRKTTFIPFSTIGLLLTFFGLYLVVLSKKKNDQESRGV